MKSQRKHRGLWLLLAGCGLWIVAVAGCSGEPPPAGPGEPGGPGELTVAVSGGVVAGHAYLLTVTGPDIGDATALGNGTAYMSTSGSTLTAVVLLGTVGDGRLLRFKVADVNAVSSYGARLVQAADAFNDPLDPGLYSVQVVR